MKDVHGRDVWSLINGVRANSRTEPTAVPAAGYLCLMPFRTEKGDPTIQASLKRTEVAHCDLDNITVGCSGSQAVKEVSAPVV